MHGGAKGSGGQKLNQNAVTSGEYTASARALHLFINYLKYVIEPDKRLARFNLVREIEILELVKLLWRFGDKGDSAGELDAIQLVALDIAADADIDWQPPKHER